MSDHDSNNTNESTPDTGLTGRSAMHKHTTTPRRGPTRRLLAGTAVLGAMALLVSAAAWACTLREGTELEVFLNSYADCGAAGVYCSKAVDNGDQTGMASVDNDEQQVLRIKGSGFVDSVSLDYSITWRKTSSTGNCHRVNGDGSIQMMGGLATVTSNGTLDVTRNALTDSTGTARICVQDYEFGGTSTASATPTVVVGQIVDVAIADYI